MKLSNTDHSFTLALLFVLSWVESVIMWKQIFHEHSGFSVWCISLLAYMSQMGWFVCWNKENKEKRVTWTWWRHEMETFLRYWPFVRGICRTLVNFPCKGQWRGALMFSLTCTWINDWVNNSEAGDLRCHCTHYDIIVMDLSYFIACWHKSDIFHDSQTNMFKINLCPWTDITWVLWHRK